MKAALCSILVAALLVGTANSLTCYGCTSKMNCFDEKICADNEKYCVTNVTMNGNDLLIRKYCSTSCVPTTACTGGPGLHEYHCCENNYCNFSGATSVKTNYAMLWVAAGVSAFLLRAGL
ncbi:lymphocyte antigen 6E-like [Lissotriton helveticus]